MNYPESVNKLGVVSKQHQLGAESKQLKLGVISYDGHLHVYIAMATLWLYGDGTTMLYGSGDEIITYA